MQARHEQYKFTDIIQYKQDNIQQNKNTYHGNHSKNASLKEGFRNLITKHLLTISITVDTNVVGNTKLGQKSNQISLTNSSNFC